MAAISNFIRTLKKSPANLHMVGNVIVKFEYVISIFKNSLAHPHVASNVMLKF